MIRTKDEAGWLRRPSSCAWRIFERRHFSQGCDVFGRDDLLGEDTGFDFELLLILEELLQDLGDASGILTTND